MMHDRYDARSSEMFTPHYHCPPCREAAIRAKIEERRRLEREKKKFAVRLEGSLAVERPPKVRLCPC